MAKLTPKFKEIHDSVYGVIFMSTPHMGISNLGSTSRTSNTAQLVSDRPDIHSRLDNIFKTNLRSFARTSEDFRDQDLKIVSFYEMYEPVSLSSL